jgi:hypothetical protein
MKTLRKGKERGDRPPPMMGGGRPRFQVDWRWWSGVTLLVLACGVAGFVLGTYLAV